MFPYLIYAAECFFVASPVLLVVGGIASMVSDYRFNKEMGR